MIQFICDSRFVQSVVSIACVQDLLFRNLRAN